MTTPDQAEPERSDAELLTDCEHRLTQLVIKEELRSGRSENIVMQICDTLREVAARLPADVSVEEVIELARKKATLASKFDLTWYRAGDEKSWWTVTGWSAMQPSPKIQESAYSLPELAAKLKPNE